MNLNRINPFIMGVIGSLSLITFYTTIMLIFTGSLKAAYDQFISLWYLMIPLIIGFGVQLGLFQSLRIRIKTGSMGKMMGGSTASSSLSMIACCAHHLTDVLPILGFSAVSVFLVNYQTPLLLLGILFNILGILYLLRINVKLSREDHCE